MSDQRGEGRNAKPVPGRAEDDSLMDRASFLLGAVAFAAIGLVLWAGFATLNSFLYPGTRTGYLSPSERAAVAEVNACRRLGPLSVHGVGYWWKCQVTIWVEDGRVVNTVVDRSIVTPADRGRKIELREACKRRGLTDCSYGRPVARGWKAAMGALLIVEWSVLGAVAFLVVLPLLPAALGRQGYIALTDRLQWAPRPPPRH